MEVCRYYKHIENSTDGWCDRFQERCKGADNCWGYAGKKKEVEEICGYCGKPIYTWVDDKQVVCCPERAIFISWRKCEAEKLSLQSYVEGLEVQLAYYQNHLEELAQQKGAE